MDADRPAIGSIGEKAARRGLAVVFTIMLLDIMGLAIIMPVLPTFLQELTGDPPARAAVDGGWLLFVYASMQFLFAPTVGNLSDRFGRRPVLLVSVLTFALDNLICALADSYWILFIGRILAGVSGASFSTASAFIADVSDERSRARNFGLIGIAFGVGFTLGPVVGGLLGSFGPRVPFFGAAALSFLNFCAACWLLPETLPKPLRRAFDWRRANPMGALKQMRGRPGLMPVLAVFFLIYQAHVVYPAIWPFAGAYRYGWSEGQIGLSLGVYGIVTALVMALVLPRVVATFGERRTAILGLATGVIALMGYALAWQGWMVYLVILATPLEAVADPPLRSLAAARVPPSEQGELQGALSSLSSLTSIVGPLMFASVFEAFTRDGAAIELPGAPFALAALLVATGLIIFLRRVHPMRG
ncbi:tetracycline resistance MFS efflux pump [Xaviernesmea oryzae]|uniref:Tetracycline resistance MFS efflux pump n=1 Tax=Xaviernesmea oryzae TaxID=464029 RepID=A0A1Q9AV70_9HYPH|nr:TCR/Tet family MFS transporter [Xaviernesmea oryzae]OLP59352.1 tetracycline resistance MFS efflux pump [Xaviernesmea oryzae]SEL63543.1 MFS transporter, DHA1 family, tetracycline resistance protein [Xaviernesmea oryzae]